MSDYEDISEAEMILRALACYEDEWSWNWPHSYQVQFSRLWEKYSQIKEKCEE